jgi:NAD(P)-dependent dehydrogenase (short-subunit alcohol dehydrogenase family)
VKGLLFTVQKALPLFHDGGSIILNASIAASKGIEASSVYNATKAAIRSFARTWTVELKHRKIRVNAISPGMIDTPGLNGLAQSQEQLEQFKTSFVSTVPLGRMGSPDEVAKVASFLASDDSSYVAGIELFVDGGVAQIYVGVLGQTIKKLDSWSSRQFPLLALLLADLHLHHNLSHLILYHLHWAYPMILASLWTC